MASNNSKALAFPSHKFNVSGCYTISKSFSVAPSASWLGKRYGYAPDDNGGSYLKTFSPVLLANLFVNCTNCIVPGLKLGAGCYNILDEDGSFIQPYNGGHSPLPGLSREFVVRISYSFVSKKQE